MNPTINSKFTDLPLGYSFRLEKDDIGRYHVILINAEGKESRLFGGDSKPLAFVSEPDKVYSVAEVRDTIIKNNVSKEDYEIHKWGYGNDLRTRNYLSRCKDNIGLISVDSGEVLDIDFKTFENWGAYALNSGDLYYKHTDDGHLLAFQTCSGDSVCNYLYVFKDKPTIKRLDTARLINKIGNAFRFKGKKYVNGFDCWECGNKVKHWLDIGGNLETKWENLQQNYCGC